MKKDIRPRKPGAKLCLVLATLLISSCRKDQPPAIDVCILDGVGGGNCVFKDGSRHYLVPSEMKNYWATSQSDMSEWSAWCYQASPKAIAPLVDAKRDQILWEQAK